MVCSQSKDSFRWVDSADVLLKSDKPVTISVSRGRSTEGMARGLDFDQLLLEKGANA
jgi:hypothetical protein